MDLGILGAGGIGRAFARQAARAGHSVLLGNRRGPASLADLARELGPRARAVTAREAARADVVLLAVTWDAVPAALDGLPAWDGRVLIDATNPVVPPDFRAADLRGRASSEVVAELAPGARVVKTANTLTPELLGADPNVAGGKRVLFVSGDDSTARTRVKQLVESFGFAVVDLGTLATGARLTQYPGGPLPGLDLVRMG